VTDIAWPTFLLVLAASLVAAVATVALFSVGVRLLATPPRGARPIGVALDGADADAGEDDPATPAAARPAGATVGAVIAFTLAGIVAVGGVVIIVH
jgi:hypothetical protein